MYSLAYLRNKVPEHSQCAAHILLQTLFCARDGPDIPIRDAQEHSAQLRHCANRLLLDAAMEESGSHITWAALYLHEMAEALLDDAGIS